ncbi:hypothetical protein BIFGAL_02831 [Bifidobacterium gallicum DSM 20093 = LMG 11596]|uniref:Uncharacterized protein n=1 Tax=Bifidobacterium gallicum DSM 20093 = LMG 11596 TaxID=561180 RepID=D1NSS1_9BIFI|nr:hypothetical protein BIFGAL_02831 [Bifidobacterium gallicum DSM 20093 = LMG 11596]
MWSAVGVAIWAAGPDCEEEDPQAHAVSAIMPAHVTAIVFLMELAIVVMGTVLLEIEKKYEKSGKKIRWYLYMRPADVIGESYMSRNIVKKLQYLAMQFRRC